MNKSIHDSKVDDREEWRERIQRALSDLRRLPHDPAGAEAGGASMPSPESSSMPG